MSQDQRPGKLRVVGSISVVPERRGDKLAADALTSTDADVDAAAGGAGLGTVLTATIFLSGCILGGAALLLLGVSG